MPLRALDDLVRQPREWRVRRGSWVGKRLELEPTGLANTEVLTSPPFRLERGRLITFTLSAAFLGVCDWAFRVNRISGQRILGGGREATVHSRLFPAVDGAQRLSIAFRPVRTGQYNLSLALALRPAAEAAIAIEHPKLLVQILADNWDEEAPASPGRDAETDTYLPQWGPVKRFIHRRCQQSRPFNNIVSAVEMRLGCEELVSLPQYMALCPTGQCNALCDFCSVTINRTGIVKRQLPFDKLDSLVKRIAKTVQLFGLEGNGEPTLHSRFPEIVDRLTRENGKAYLITNGSRLRPDDVSLLMALESVNFSLNAATAETHRRVMKLRNFEEIVEIIRALSAERGLPGAGWEATPQISVSFVVTHQNIHEAQDFVRLADRYLGVDHVLIRPLSELGNDLGSVEDLRDIVPFESDVRDMLDAVRDYTADMPPHADIRIAPETFVSARPDPVGQLQMPPGCSGKLLAPRRRAWRVCEAGVQITWHLDTARVIVPATDRQFLATDLIDIVPGAEQTFAAKVDIRGGPVTLSIVDQSGTPLGSALLEDTGSSVREVAIPFQSGAATAVSIALTGHGNAGVVDIDFGRLRTPARFIEAGFRIPEGRHWEVCVDGMTVEWPDGALHLRAECGGGPYLLKSYGISCGRDRLVNLPFRIQVRKGTVSIGVLNDRGSEFLDLCECGEGDFRSSLLFMTGADDRVRLVVSAPPGREVDCVIDWPARNLRPAESDEVRQAIRLPPARYWRSCTVDADVAVAEGDDASLSISWPEGEGAYLARSDKFWCGRKREAEIPLSLEVKQGRVAVGVLDASEIGWLTSAVFDPGCHETVLRFDLGSDGRASVVVSRADRLPGMVELRLKKAGEPELSVTQVACDGAGPAAGEMPAPIALELAAPAGASDSPVSMPPKAAPHAVPTDRPSAASPARVGLARRLRRATFPKTPYSCQKPWTDLNNFSVDGRMDVCCIATGPSQTRYQLGNLNQHTFQQIWNGPTAREFRRTVNSENPLPPCVRCPMLRAYQGLWFDPGFTRAHVENRIAEIGKHTWAARLAGRLAGRLVMGMFAGFAKNQGKPLA